MASRNPSAASSLNVNVDANVDITVNADISIENNREKYIEVETPTILPVCECYQRHAEQCDFMKYPEANVFPYFQIAIDFVEYNNKTNDVSACEARCCELGVACGGFATFEPTSQCFLKPPFEVHTHVQK